MEKTINEIDPSVRISRKERRMIKKKNTKKKFGKSIAVILSFFFLLGIIALGLIRFGVFSNLQELLVTSAMTTMSHKYIANIFANDEQIKTIMDKNKVIEEYEKFDVSMIKEDLPEKSWDKIEIKDISKDGYTGYMLTITNPERVFLATSKNLGSYGSKITQLVEDNNAFAGVNAGGFSDENGKGKGGTPTGIIIKNGEILYIDKNIKKFNIIGFNKDNILVVGQYRLNEINNLNLRDAVDFRPFLIVNGKPTKMYGNGGWGTGPRTAIGQKADGTILFVVIDGRQLHSRGATMKQLQEIMIENNAINAANLDGGSSSVIYFDNRIINSPSSPYGDRYLPSAFLIDKGALSDDNIINNLDDEKDLKPLD